MYEQKKSVFHISLLITVELQHQKQSSSHRNTLKVKTEQKVLQCLQLVDVKHCKAALGGFLTALFLKNLHKKLFRGKREQIIMKNKIQHIALSTQDNPKAN